LVRLDSKKMEPGRKSARNCAELWSVWFLTIPSGDGQYGVAGQMPCKNLRNMWEDHVTQTFPRSTVPYILPIIIMPTWCRQHLGPLPPVYPQSSLFCWPLLALYPYGNGDTREDFLNHSNHLITGVSHNYTMYMYSYIIYIINIYICEWVVPYLFGCNRPRVWS
jgi:hypothetical protein